MRKRIKGLKPEYYDKQSLLFNKGRVKDEKGIEYILPYPTPINLNRDLDTGTPCKETWYYVWICRKRYNKTAKLIFSCSYTVPTLPKGYHFYTILPIAIRYSGKHWEDYNEGIMNFQVYNWNHGNPTYYLRPYTPIRSAFINIKCSDMVK